MLTWSSDLGLGGPAHIRESQTTSIETTQHNLDNQMFKKTPSSDFQSGFFSSGPDFGITGFT